MRCLRIETNQSLNFLGRKSLTGDVGRRTSGHQRGNYYTEEWDGVWDWNAWYGASSTIRLAQDWHYRIWNAIE